MYAMYGGLVRRKIGGCQDLQDLCQLYSAYAIASVVCLEMPRFDQRSCCSLSSAGFDFSYRIDPSSLECLKYRWFLRRPSFLVCRGRLATIPTRSEWGLGHRRRMSAFLASRCVQAGKTLKLWSGHQPITQNFPNFRRGQIPVVRRIASAQRPATCALALFGRRPVERAERLARSDI